MTITKKELLQKIKSLGKIDKETRNKIVCDLVGHSRIKTMSFDYHYCGRCDTKVGDSLGGIYDGANDVVIGHDCSICRKNYKECSWRDKLYTPNPFNKK